MIKLYNYNILIIDDDNAILELLEKNIKRLDDVMIDVSPSYEDAIDKLSSKQFHLVISDYHLKPNTAIDVLDYVRINLPKIPIIVITGGNENEKENSLKNGATFFFSKPYDYMELTYVVKNLLELYEANENLENAENIIMALSKAIDAKDSYTEGHSRRVADIAIEIYDSLGIKDDDEKKALYMGCILHDIGKIGIPDAILLSSNRLLPEERQMMETHPERGYEICKNLANLKHALPVIRGHHEKLDGSGYPDKLIDIPIIVQIVAIADIFDALTSKRVYRKENSIEEAIEIMRKEAKENKINSSILDTLEKIWIDRSIQ